MAPARRLANLVAVAVLAAAGVLRSAAATAVPDTPVHPSTWATPSRQRRQGKASMDSSHQRLEDQASRETRETFGEDFCQQLEDEQRAVRTANEGRARISREVGCSAASPLSSPSLGGVEVPGNDNQAAKEGATQNDLGGPTIGDWLR